MTEALYISGSTVGSALEGASWILTYSQMLSRIATLIRIHRSTTCVIHVRTSVRWLVDVLSSIRFSSLESSEVGVVNNVSPDAIADSFLKVAEIR